MQMNKSDIAQFKSTWIGMSETLSGAKQSDIAANIAFRLLADHSMESVMNALMQHAGGNSWMPSPSQVIDIINPPEPELTPELLAGLARADNSPLGTFVKYKVTAFDVGALNDYALRGRIKSLMPQINEFIVQFRSGRLSPDSARLMNLRGLSESRSLTATEPRALPSAPVLLNNDIEDRGVINPRVRRLVAGSFKDVSTES